MTDELTTDTHATSWPSIRNGFATLLGQPINRLLLLAFSLVALLLLAFLSWQLHQMSWRDAWREIDEKHRLLAENMVAPIQIYVHDHAHILSLLADSLALDGEIGATTGLSPRQYQLLETVERNPNGFRTLTLMSIDGDLLHSNRAGGADDTVLDRLRGHKAFLGAIASAEPQISGIDASPFDQEPTLIMSHPLRDGAGQVAAVLLAELSVERIEALRRNIHFGDKGHSAIVDQDGRVIAHPNGDWMRSMRDLSHLSVVEKMMTGETGVTEFYSPFIKQDMVAGFTAVPEIGWGIMVPQPKTEVSERVKSMLFNQVSWMMIGLVMAVLLSFLLSRWITQPLKHLAQTAGGLVGGEPLGTFPNAQRHAPREVQELSRTIGDLVNSLNHSYRQIDDLNRDLQRRVTAATEELRIANTRLAALAAQDHLTGLANRRQFEVEVEKRLRALRNTDGPLTLILIDVDNFKHINDRYGHAAGDAVLVWMGEILNAFTRGSDLVARYAGDEFVLCVDCDLEQARHKAESLVRRVAEQLCPWGNDGIPVSVSAGINQLAGSGMTLDRWFPQVDQAMYRAKQAGRNQVSA